MFDENWIQTNINDKPIFKTAFTHRSFLNETDSAKVSNERLEFLGDAVLSLIISTYIFKLRQDDSEGLLTNLRSFIVKTNSLALASEKLKLGRFLLLSKGEELTGGRENPQLLANTYEALLGAIYLDEGLEVADQFVRETLLPLFQEEIQSGPPKDAKSKLQEITQNKVKQSPRYRIIATRGPDHAKEFTVGAFIGGKKIGEGTGFSKQVAEEEAASEGLRFLEQNNLD